MGTPPHHHLCSRKKKSRENVGCSFCIERFHEKNKEKRKTQTEKDPTAKKKIIDEMPDQSYMTPNISYKFEKHLKRDGVFSQKNKNNKKNTPIQRKKKKKKKKKS